MSTTPTRSDVTHSQIVADLGVLTVSSISRIRSGDREPQYTTIWRIKDVYHWPIYDQVEAIIEGNYAEKFERRLDLHYFGPKDTTDD